MNWETFQKAYLAADPALKNIIDSESIPNAIDACIEQHLLAPDKSQTVLRLYPLLVLKVITVEKLQAELQAADIPNSFALITALNQSVTTPSNPAVSTDELQSEIAETEAALDAVPPMRTMAGDMAAHQQPTGDNPGAIHYPNQPATPTASVQPTVSPVSTATPAPSVAATDIPHNLPTTPTSPDEPVYTTTQEAILRERPAANHSPQPYDPTPTNTPPTLAQQARAAETTTPDPDEIRWGSTN